MTHGIAVAALIGLTFAVPRVALAQAADEGAKLFTANKCNMCHSVSSANIKATNASTKAPDLSTLAAASPPADVANFLKGSAAKKHPMKFSGSDQDLATLTGWLSKQVKK